jgi:hypothetical protein
VGFDEVPKTSTLDGISNPVCRASRVAPVVPIVETPLAEGIDAVADYLQT